LQSEEALMGCNCGGGGSGLGNYVVKDANGKELKRFTAVRETEAKAFAAKTPGSSYAKTS
jgi:hypothetical protein